MAEGYKNQAIAADTLFSSHGTLRIHVHTILPKFNAKDRTQAALFVVKHDYNQRL